MSPPSVIEKYAPDGTMDGLATEITIEASQSVTFNGLVSDPDNADGHTYEWDFDGGASDSAQQNPGDVQFNATGTYYVQFTVTDPDGNVDETPDIVMVNVIITNPTAPGSLDLSAGSDSGVSDSDDITNDNTPTFTWTASSDMSGIAGYWWAVDNTNPEVGGIFTTELMATLPALSDGSHILYVKAQDATPAGYLSDASAIPFTVDTIGANVQQWQSKQTHGAAGEITTVIANGYVESRYAGITKLVIDLDEALDPASVGIGDLSVVGVTNGDQIGLISSVTASEDKVTVQLSAALPDIDTYTITLGQDVRDVAGNQMSGPKQITVKALRGDANGDGQVNSFDLLNIRAFVGQAVTAANARCDINGDGVINSFDQLMARVYVGNKIT
ncbi:MAG TPA: Ig-like domain-containing protein [Candidatus Brocadiia bacterium]|nr:Ig-like domain-containing protein [Candidatus Brocadiia bacterium]